MGGLARSVGIAFETRLQVTGLWVTVLWITRWVTGLRNFVLWIVGHPAAPIRVFRQLMPG